MHAQSGDMNYVSPDPYTDHTAQSVPRSGHCLLLLLLILDFD